MRKTVFSLFLGLFVVFSINAQSLSSVKGAVSDSDRVIPLLGLQ